MQSIPRALIWELFHRGRWHLLAAFLGANAFPIFLLAALTWDGPFDPAAPVMIMIHFILIQISALTFGAAVHGAQGGPRQLYAWPVPTATLVLWRMLPAMFLVATQSLCTALLINRLFHADWPLWGPALFVAAAVASVQAVVWYTEKPEWLIPTLIVLATCLGLWLKSRYGSLTQFTHAWQEVSIAEVATLLVVIGLSYQAAVRGIARSRRGDTLPSLHLTRRLERLFNPAPAINAPFRSGADAQFWFEWRKKGWAMPAVVLFGLTIGILWWLIVNRTAQGLYEGFLGGGGMLSVAGMIGGVLMGNTGPNDGNYEIAQFQAVRPLTTTDMSRILLRIAARSTFQAWAIWAGAFAAAASILWLTGSLPRPLVPPDVAWWYLPVTLLGPWVIVSVGAALGLTGWLSSRSRSMMVTLSGLIALGIILPLLAKYLLTAAEREQLAHAVVIVFGVVCVLATAWAFRAALGRSLIETPLVYACAAVFIMLTAAILSAHWFRPGQSLHFTAFCIGIAALTVAAPATAPLALARNRHR